MGGGGAGMTAAASASLRSGKTRAEQLRRVCCDWYVVRCGICSAKWSV